MVRFGLKCVDWSRCGNDAVCLSWPSSVLVLGPFGDWIEYKYKGHCAMIDEIDGIRLFSHKNCEFIQKVPGFFIFSLFLAILTFPKTVWRLSLRLDRLNQRQFCMILLNFSRFFLELIVFNTR